MTEDTPTADSSPGDRGFDPETHLEWTYEEGEEAVLITRGFPDQYDLNYIAIIKLDPAPREQELLELITLASQDRRLIEDIDLERPPGEVHQLLQDRRIEVQLDGAGIDNQVIRDKFRKLFLRGEFTSPLFEFIRENRTHELRDFVKKQIQERVFPGTHVEQEVHLFPWVEGTFAEEEPEPEIDGSGNSSQSFPDKTGDGSRILTIAPRIRPFLGTTIGNLSPGDVFEVRVVGDSAQRLRPEFLDGAASEDEPFSKPLEARLIALEQGDVPQEIRFLVELAEDVHGVGIAARDARVLHNEQLVRARQPTLLYGLKITLFVCSVVLLLTLFLMFVFV